MNLFQETLRHVNQTIYIPKQLTVNFIQEEKQNAEYGAGVFNLFSKTIRFRVAKITSAKIGQFVFPKEIIIKKNILRSPSTT